MPKNPDTSEEGLERLRAAVRANPRSTAFVALAHSLCETGRAAEAEDVCRDGLNRHPGLVTGQVALGRALLERGRLREAQEVLVEAAKANPDHGEAFRWLAEVVVKRGDPDRARTLLEYAEELSPSDGRVSELLIEVGGTPVFRSVRPRSDFERTRVGNARALAERMHEDFEPRRARVQLLEDMTAAELEHRPNLAFDEPTVVDGAAALDAWASAGGTAPVSAELPASPLPWMAGGPEAAALAAPGAGHEPPVVASNGGRAPVTGPVTPAPLLGGAGGGTGAAAGWAYPFTGGPRSSGAMAALTGPALSGPPAELTPPLVRPAPPMRRLVLIGTGGVLLALLVVGVLSWLARSRSGEAADPAREQMRRAVASGSLRSLLLARDLGAQLAASAGGDGDALAALGFVSTLLARDYGLPTRGNAQDALDRAAAAPGTGPARTAVVEASRALLALGGGELAAAQEASARAVAAGSEAAPSLLAAARVKVALGDMEGAREDLERLLSRMPEFSAGVLDFAALALDLGDPAAAIKVLTGEIGRTRDHLRARLLLAEAQRAQGERPANNELASACLAEGTEAPSLRAACRLQAAATLRLEGDRAGAIENARAAAAESPDDPRLLAGAAQVLAGLGEVDAASAAVDRLRKLVADTSVPRAWAELSLRLGRRQQPNPGPFLTNATGPERRMLAARARLAEGGPELLRRDLEHVVPGPLVGFDPDLKALAMLARDGMVSRAERGEMERRADRGDPVAAYVLGCLAEKASEPKVAVRRLERALIGHGDACDAATRYRALLGRASPTPYAARALRELRVRNSACPAVAQL